MSSSRLSYSKHVGAHAKTVGLWFYHEKWWSSIYYYCLRRLRLVLDPHLSHAVAHRKMLTGGLLRMNKMNIENRWKSDTNIVEQDSNTIKPKTLWGLDFKTVINVPVVNYRPIYEVSVLFSSSRWNTHNAHCRTQEIFSVAKDSFHLPMMP